MEFFDLNCSDVQKFCLTTTDGTAQCGDLCPPGLDTFGVCDGAVAKRCDGALYREEDCGKAGEACVQLDRFGVGCRGCPHATTVGECSATSQITGCTASGKELHESCVARGGSCGFSDAECRNTCLDPKPQVACASEELAEGQTKCKENPVTHFWSILTCTEGRVVESECPAASDGSVTCAEVDGGAPSARPSAASTGGAAPIAACSSRAPRRAWRGWIARSWAPSAWTTARMPSARAPRCRSTPRAAPRTSTDGP